MFYILFEIRLLPISIIIMGWGYQPERSPAFIYIFIYTVRGSIPLLLRIFWLVSSLRISDFFILPCLSRVESRIPNYSNYSPLLQHKRITSACLVRLILGFLVKFPIYGLHLWLPKAHVEAPVGGSIVLAGLLLKLGGFGLIQFSPLICSSVMVKILSRIRILGGVLVATLCLRQTDIKVLIAYSSVRHLRIAIIAIFRKTSTQILRALIVLSAHGISSPGIFYRAYILYERTHSRSLLINLRTYSFIPLFSMWFFIVVIANIGTPPTFNFMGELLRFWTATAASYTSLIFFPPLVFLGGAYSLVLYASSQQGQKFLKTNTPILSLRFIENLRFVWLALPVFLWSVTSNFITR